MNFEDARDARKPIRYLCVASAGITILALALDAGAASPAAATRPSVAKDDVLEEVVVTAEKRAGTVQTTPFSISAIGALELESRGVTNVEDAVREVPGISMRSGGPDQTEFEMRGLSSTGGASPTVGFYVDDAPLTPPVLALNGKVVVDPDLFDLNRIEVLRGPQGTLYGSGSMGGTIRLITNSPNTTDFSGAVSVDGSRTAGGGGNGTANAMINLPIVDGKAAVRVVLTDKYISGWIDRIVENPFPLPSNTDCTPTIFQGCARGDVANGTTVARYNDVNWARVKAGRAKLLVTPTSNLRIETTFMYQDVTQGGANTFDVPPGPSGKPAHYQPADIAEPFSDRFTLASNVITYDGATATFSAATTYWNRTEGFTQDVGEAIQNIYWLPTALSTTDQFSREDDSSHQFSEELRIASNGDNKLKWILGAFFSDLTSQYNGYGYTPELCDFSVGGCAANPKGIVFEYHNPYRIKQYAAFGEAAYKLAPDWTLTIGLRYFNFDNTVTTAESGLFSPSANADVTTAHVHSTNSGVTPKVNLSYQPNAQLTVYGTISQGFRPGGVNLPLPMVGPNSCVSSLDAVGLTAGPDSYGPDKVWNYEVGEKAKFLDGALTINSDLYYIQWKGIQQPITLACGFYYTGNAGNAESYGPELELSYRLSPDFTLDLNGTYTHATIVSLEPNTGLTVGQSELNVPKYTADAALVYRHKMDGGRVLTARIADSVVGPSTDIAFTYVPLKSYNILDARLGFELGAYSVAIYGRNLGNTQAWLTANNTSAGINSPSLTRVTTNQPRTIGIELNARF